MNHLYNPSTRNNLAQMADGVAMVTFTVMPILLSIQFAL